MTEQAPETAPLILSQEELRRGGKRKQPIAGIVYVYADANGELFVPAGRLPFGDGWRARVRYEVDASDHLDTIEGELPSVDEAFHFRFTADISWHVTDPTAVVRRRVGDGLGVIRPFLLHRMRQISRGYHSDECARADRDINTNLGLTGSIVMAEGITIESFVARLALDELPEQHKRARATQAAELQLDADRRIAVEAALQGGNIALIREHLVRHRDDTGAVISLIERGLGQSEQTKRELFNKLVDAGVLQDVDLDRLRDITLASVADNQIPFAVPSSLTSPPAPSLLAAAPASANQAPDTPTPSSAQPGPGSRTRIVGWTTVAPPDDDVDSTS